MKIKPSLILVVALLVIVSSNEAFGQVAIEEEKELVVPNQIVPIEVYSYSRFLDTEGGVTASEAVKIALRKNELLNAFRAEVEAASNLIKQASAKANPMLGAEGSSNPLDVAMYSMGASLVLPLELGNRRASRIAVASQEYEMKSARLIERERILAYEVRKKFGVALAGVEKLRLVEEMLISAEQGYKLISARVNEGDVAPLAKNFSLVSVNRLRVNRERQMAETESRLLELKNEMGLSPDENLRLKGALFVAPRNLPNRSIAEREALNRRPDLKSLRFSKSLAEARLEQAESAGRTDASVSIGYKLMTRIRPQLTGNTPESLIMSKVRDNFITFGVQLKLPFRDKNKGAIEASAAEIQAAENRLRYGELSIKSQVAQAYLAYEGALAAVLIYRAGVSTEAKRNLETIWKTFELGDTDLVNYVGEEREFLKIEEGRIEAELNVYLAELDIDFVTNDPKLRGN